LKAIFEKGITHEDIIIILNTLTTHFPQNAKSNDFSLLKVQDFPQTFFVPHQPFGRELLKQKIQIWKNWK
jgi:hypothetical protein